ncbi:Holliday junction branch migration protein RuvA [Lentibacillus cibarius]|uniref:Holliday junction branch migration complex subunit RuvA n=1 Tax=Lentibacillus cibarius TaxID=2583219 RepID=A0A5S3QGP5_9BACI|nr:Holliday junction branch migration protein RuvA [Lentibacillus cibarius]TMN21065.1 Holliday junction branch migration protein RuvA [Lentibacillus cibarius]
MIAYIKGLLVRIQGDAVIVDVQGIGYEIVCADPYAFQASINKQVTISTYHYVREDIQILYGFKSEEEKLLFTKLITVSGIGPKGALAMLGATNGAGLVNAIEREDDAFLVSLPGIGKKTARQIILDLKGKLPVVTPAANEPKETADQVHASPEVLQETQEVLKSLGYTDREIRTVATDLQKENVAGTDELVRKALALLVEQ